MWKLLLREGAKRSEQPAALRHSARGEGGQPHGNGRRRRRRRCRRRGGEGKGGKERSREARPGEEERGRPAAAARQNKPAALAVRGFGGEGGDMTGIPPPGPVLPPARCGQARRRRPGGREGRPPAALTGRGGRRGAAGGGGGAQTAARGLRPPLGRALRAGEGPAGPAAWGVFSRKAINCALPKALMQMQVLTWWGFTTTFFFFLFFVGRRGGQW